MALPFPTFLEAGRIAIFFTLAAFIRTGLTAEPDRVAAARGLRGETVRALCTAAQLHYPPKELFLRAFKQEDIVEAWGRDGTGEYRLIKAFQGTARSGKAGPKRREGDLQVPEGFYHIDAFNPVSRFHLSLRVSYPNASDRLLSDRDRPGGDIYIHGGSASIGCLPIGDEQIEELYLLALDVSKGRKGVIPVHIFPTRMAGADWEAFQQEHTSQRPDLAVFWAQLKPGYDAFEKTHRLPQIHVEANGRYDVRSPAE